MLAILTQTTALANDFVQLSFASQATFAPGQYIMSHQLLSYVASSHSNQFSIIIPKHQAQHLAIEQTISIAGHALGPPTDFTLLMADNGGLNAALFYLRTYRYQFQGLVLIGTHQGFPFHPCPSHRLVAGLPSEVIAAIPLFEDWGITSRLANTIWQPGCYEGSVFELAHYWLGQQSIKVTQLTIPNLI